MKRPESSCSTVGLENPHTKSNQSSRALDCILALDKLAERPGVTLVEIHKALAALLPPAAEFPEATSARVTVDGAAYASPLFRVTDCMLAREVPIGDAKIARLELARIQDMGCPFTSAEERLLTVAAHRLGRLTERFRLEAHLRRAQRLEAVGTLAGGIAHDFNNVLTAILGHAELARLALPPGQSTHEHIRQVIVASHRARRLVEQILTTVQQEDIGHKPIRVHEVVQEVVDLMRSTLPATIEVRTNLARGLLAHGNANQIHQVVLNLCTNAQHAMQERMGLLDIQLTAVILPLPTSSPIPLPPGTYAKISVRDTGHGMTREILDRIFDPYFTTKAKGQGTGLGLAVAHTIVQSHGGFIRACSEDGQGTTFEVFLPATGGLLEAEQLEYEPVPCRGTERVLVVDDEPMLTELVDTALSHLGYHVDTAPDGAAALRSFRGTPERFDIVVTDLTMPGMTGKHLACAIWKVRPAMPIIICSGNTVSMDEPQALALGFRAFVRKPYTMVALAARIRRALDD